MFVILCRLRIHCYYFSTCGQSPHCGSQELRLQVGHTSIWKHLKLSICIAVVISYTAQTKSPPWIWSRANSIHLSYPLSCKLTYSKRSIRKYSVCICHLSSLPTCLLHYSLLDFAILTEQGDLYKSPNSWLRAILNFLLSLTVVGQNLSLNTSLPETCKGDHAHTKNLQH